MAVRCRIDVRRFFALWLGRAHIEGALRMTSGRFLARTPELAEAKAESWVVDQLGRLWPLVPNHRALGGASMGDRHDYSYYFDVRHLRVADAEGEALEPEPDFDGPRVPYPMEGITIPRRSNRA